ncbi:hypothetical protein ASE76_17435 [Xylophilus sp. Leaf220]|nr:hypothetical protein ASE76_17435 [Xylophilus sp. Leaf220]
MIEAATAHRAQRQARPRSAVGMAASAARSTAPGAMHQQAAASAAWPLAAMAQPFGPPQAMQRAASMSAGRSFACAVEEGRVAMQESLGGVRTTVGGNW